MANDLHRRLVRRWLRAQLRRIVQAAVKPGPPAPGLVHHVDGAPGAEEILAPSHAAIRRGVVALSAQPPAMDHDDRHVMRRDGDLILHVHLPRRDLPGARHIRPGGQPAQPFGMMRLPPMKKLPWDWMVSGPCVSTGSARLAGRHRQREEAGQCGVA